MARTILPEYDEPIDPKLNLEQFRDDLRDYLRSAKADEDKSGDVDSAAYYEGNCDAIQWVLNYICTKTVNFFVPGYGRITRVTESEAQFNAHSRQDVGIYFFDE
jgi:hypothetical protein